MELFKGFLSIFIIYIICVIAQYYDNKNKKERKIIEECKKFFEVKPTNNIGKVEEWCKRQLERNCNK